MMNMLQKVLTVCCLLVTLPVLAQQPQRSAVEAAEAGVRELLQTVSESQSLFSNNREEYFERIEQVLDRFVDFNAVAEVVMSRYASQATGEQTQRFADILKNTLTRFYGAALVSYDDQELVFLPPRNESSDPRADTVVGMELRGGDNGVIRFQYQMFLNEDNEWKLKNLSLGGINLGRQYFTQFAAAMSSHNNDIDQVLDNWQ
ncbi:MAG: ABC transporter substrate-binding protein [Pseudohongiellaceae bacterium]